MLDWYEDFIYGGKNRFLINFIVGLLLLGVFIALMCIPTSMVDSLLTNASRTNAFKDMQDWAFAGIFAVVGCGFFFIGLDLMRDPDGIAWLGQKIILGLGILMIIASCAVGVSGYNTCHEVDKSQRDVLAAVFAAVPSCGFLAGILSFAGYYFAEDIEILEKLCPFITLISFIIGYGVDVGLAYL